MEEHYDFSQAERGAVLPASPNKTRITIRLDGDIVDWFKQQVLEAGGGNYQTLINEALRGHIDDSDRRLEEMLRRVVREELDRRAPALDMIAESQTEYDATQESSEEDTP